MLYHKLHWEARGGGAEFLLGGRGSLAPSDYVALDSSDVQISHVLHFVVPRRRTGVNNYNHNSTSQDVPDLRAWATPCIDELLICSSVFRWPDYRSGIDFPDHSVRSLIYFFSLPSCRLWLNTVPISNVMPFSGAVCRDMWPNYNFSLRLFADPCDQFSYLIYSLHHHIVCDKFCLRKFHTGGGRNYVT